MAGIAIIWKPASPVQVTDSAVVTDMVMAETMDFTLGQVTVPVPAPVLAQATAITMTTDAARRTAPVASFGKT